jgi:hypothetical protein
MVSAQRVSPTGPGALSVGRQAFPPTVSKELHNVIWNPVAEAWVAKLVAITINPSAVTIAKIVNIVFVCIITYRLR